MLTLKEKLAKSTTFLTMFYQERWDRHTEQDFLWVMAREHIGKLPRMWKYPFFQEGPDFRITALDRSLEVFRGEDIQVVEDSYLEFVLYKLRTETDYTIECSFAFGYFFLFLKNSREL